MHITLKSIGVLFPDAQAKEIIHYLMETFPSDLTTQEQKPEVCANGKAMAIHSFLGFILTNYLYILIHCFYLYEARFSRCKSLVSIDVLLSFIPN